MYVKKENMTKKCQNVRSDNIVKSLISVLLANLSVAGAPQACHSPSHSELEWNFCVGFSWEGLQVTHMVFAYHWTS